MTKKWKKEDKKRKIATLIPTGVFKIVTGCANELPGGPAIYLATIGKEKSLARDRTITA